MESSTFLNKRRQFATDYNVQEQWLNRMPLLGVADSIYNHTLYRQKLEEKFVSRIRYHPKHKRQEIIKMFYAHGTPVNPHQIAQTIVGLFYLIFANINPKVLKYGKSILKDLNKNYDTLRNYETMMMGKNEIDALFGMKKLLKLSQKLSDPVDYIIKLYLSDLADIGLNQAEKIVVMAIIFKKRRTLMHNDECDISTLETQLDKLRLNLPSAAEYQLRKDLQDLKEEKQQLQRKLKQYHQFLVELK